MLTVTEINIKKVQKQDLEKNLNVKGCRDGMPKCKQDRNDIIVKVNVQIPIPASFQLQTGMKTMQE